MVTMWIVLSAFVCVAAEYPPSLPGARVEIYKQVRDTQLRLYVFEPDLPGTNRPAIVFFFGGGWHSGTPAQFESHCRHFAARGMVAITADYRVDSRQNVKPADCVADAKSCIRWVRRNAARLGIDPWRIVAAGGSAGGHLAAATATLAGFDEPGEDTSISAVPNALVLFNPALILAPFEGVGRKGFGAGLGKERLGAEPPAISPIHQVKAGIPPTLIQHGMADTTVPYATVEAFTKVMKKMGNRCELIGYPGQQHGFFNAGRGDDRYFRETLDAADQFLVSLGYLVPRSHAVSQPEPARVAAATTAKPNIVFILADDLGYGDVQCLNPQGGKIKTPNLDRLAAQGMTFTDAHGASSVCTPTRYGVLTGRYPWRTRLQSGVLGGFSPPLIEPGRLTVPALLKAHGYATIGVGKWHLGMNWTRKDAGPLGDGILGGPKDAAAMNSVDWTKPIQNGPMTVGFDDYFGISASLDMPPFVFLENDHVSTAPTVEKKWIRSGPAAADFEAVEVLPRLAAKAIEQINLHAAEARVDKPFFLYLPLSSPHTPIVPSPEWRGRSGLGDYADFVMQTDAVVGQIAGAIQAQGLTGNTLFIATSDNGFSPAGDPKGQLRAQGHRPSAQFRGYKADIWDGGHRIPFFVRWPGRVKPGSSSDQLICLNDLMATCADLVGAKLPDNAGEDSVSIVPAMLGSASGPLHEAVVHHSIDGCFAIRQGNWKLELCPGSGGWSEPKPGSAQEKGLPPVQLYDLSTERGEQQNLQAEHPEVVARLTRLLEKYVADGRSTPGRPQPNDVPISLLKQSRTTARE